jgi:predicted helicase
MIPDSFIRSCPSFSAFFEKAKALTSKQKGNVFERVVQLHLKTKPKYASQLDEVWQLNEVPKDVRDFLNLPKSDQGIDLIARNVDGTYWSIQAKYLSNPDGRLKWGEKGGLSTYTALSFNTCKNIAHGLVCSTANRPLTKTHLTGKKVGFELYGDLLELDDNDSEGWKRLKQGLSKKPEPPKKLKPRPHQKRAIDNSKKHYIKEGNSRGKMIMPCGCPSSYKLEQSPA